LTRPRKCETLSRDSLERRLHFHGESHRMNAFVAAAITFACTFGACWIAMMIRSALPPSHQAKESQDVVRLGMGLVATMTALLLGLVTAAAKGSFDSQDNAIRTAAANVLALDRLLARYGPETQPTRDLLRATMAYRLQVIWPSSRSPRLETRAFEGGSGAETVENQILALTPTTDAQRWFKSESLKLTEDIVKARWRILGSAEGSVPTAFLLVVVCWLTATFASFGLFAPRNATVMAVFFVAALSVAAAVFLILELDRPFEGAIKISSGPFRYAVENLGK